MTSFVPCRTCEPSDEGRNQHLPSLLEGVDTVLLDMDGTLLDKYFDDYFWEELVPQVYAEKNRISRQQAKGVLLAKYRAVENSLKWTDLDYWSSQLDLDIYGLKCQIRHLIGIRPYTAPFLQFLRDSGRRLYLVTNADPRALALKMEQVPLTSYFHSLITSKEVGLAKEQPEFWEQLARYIDYRPSTTLFIDDTERVLQSAQRGGLTRLLHVAKPSSRQPCNYSSHFVSVANFLPLLPTRVSHVPTI